MANIKGLEGLEKHLNDISNLDIESFLQKGCALVERDAKKKAPKDTGALRRSITTDVKSNKGTVYTPLEYAPYIEYGTGLFAEKGGRVDVPWNYQDDEGKWHKTSGQKPQPFMRTALNENRSQIIELAKELIKEGIK